MIARTFKFYKRWVSPALHSLHGYAGACRFVPSCSEYAAGALRQHGVLYGSGLAVWRLLRCNPLSRGGFDPVPETSAADTLSRGRLGGMDATPAGIEMAGEPNNKNRGRERLLQPLRRR